MAEGAAEWLSRAESEGVEVGRASYEVVVESYASSSNTAAATWWLNHASEVNGGIKLRRRAYLAVLNAHAQAREAEPCQRVLASMESAGLRPDALCYNAVIEAHTGAETSFEETVAWLSHMHEA